MNESKLTAGTIIQTPNNVILERRLTDTKITMIINDDILKEINKIFTAISENQLDLGTPAHERGVEHLRIGLIFRDIYIAVNRIISIT